MLAMAHLAQQLSALAYGIGLAPVREEAEVPDAHETMGENVPQKAPEECVGLEGHGLDTVALTAVTIREAEAAVGNSDDTVVGNRYPMGVASDGVQDLFGTGEGERRLRLDDPRLAGALRREPCKALGCPEGPAVSAVYMKACEAEAWCNASRNFPRKTVLSARTGKRKRGGALCQCWPSAASAPAALTQCSRSHGLRMVARCRRVPCKYRVVVSRDRCPSRIWIVRTSMPASSRWVANECRHAATECDTAWR